MFELKGKEVSDRLKDIVQKELENIAPYIPTLAIVRVGDNKDDISYENSALKKIEAMGMRVRLYKFDKDIDNDGFLSEFSKINSDKAIDGILLFKPLPAQIDSKAVDGMIDVRKDMDGISPLNIAKLFLGEQDTQAPCTAAAVMELIKYYGIDLSGKNVAIIGRSMVVGKPLSMLFLREDATVSICHSKTRDIKKFCKNADIIILAAGKRNIISSEYTKDNAVIIDVGINFDENNKICGDADFDSFIDTDVKITPVPGGVGTVTTTVLGLHLIKSAIKIIKS